MSIATELINYETFLTNAYDVAEQKKAIMPEKKNLQNLAPTLESIKSEEKTYTELEYIESTGTQYIDTGFIPTANSKFELDIQYTVIPTGWGTTDSFRNGIGGVTEYSRFICGYSNDGFYYGIGGLNIDKTSKET